MTDYQLPEITEQYVRVVPQRSKVRTALTPDEAEHYGILCMELTDRISDWLGTDRVALMVERQAWSAMQHAFPRLREFDGPERSDG